MVETVHMEDFEPPYVRPGPPQPIVQNPLPINEQR